MMTNETQEIKVEHEGVEVRYLVGTNLWEFELRGRTRTAPSLAKARESIDKEPKAKRKPFERFDAYKLDHWSNWEKVTITSYAGKGSWDGRHQFWTTKKITKGFKAGKEERSRIDAQDLVCICEDTAQKRLKLDELKAREKALNDEMDTLIKSFKRVEPTKEMLEE